MIVVDVLLLDPLQKTTSLRVQVIELVTIRILAWIVELLNWRYFLFLSPDWWWWSLELTWIPSCTLTIDEHDVIVGTHWSGDDSSLAQGMRYCAPIMSVCVIV